ncbi:ferritin-like domain-containing protein [Erythrobacter sp.]|jgi:ferritin-like metal-binding protein YciE|uniref:ferritin-like domain-containing protein n=1 Tax=Erythrobacter sp. TaxID=1042 RepID=UPI002EC51FCB|nr:ferritin-like domain-containing protein [Erythrobacter sp.]
MSIATLKDLYIDQLQDIYSADKQSLEATKKLRECATSETLKDALDAGTDGIKQGIEKVRGIIKTHDADPTDEFCKGMEGLVKEAHAHAIDADNIKDEDVRDASIIAQYQRMTHYGIAGYGTAASFARRLGLEDDAKILRDCLENTYGGDRTMTDIASGEVNRQAMA